MSARPLIAEFDLQADSMLGGATAVEASAGTGKTWTIERIVLARVLAGVEMKRIALMSFTRAAADELAERVRGTLNERLADPVSKAAERGLLERALLDFDAACISTIHGFCQRMLQEHAAEAGVLGLAGWTLDPDPAGSERLALADAYSATAMQDPVWSTLAHEPKDLSARLRKALEKARVREQVEKADFRRAVENWRAVTASVHAAKGVVDALREIVAHTSKKAGEPISDAAEALAAWQDGPCEHVEAAVAASEALCKVAGVLLDEAQALEGALKRGGDHRSPIQTAHRAELASRAGDLKPLLEAWPPARQQASDTVVARALEMLSQRRERRRQFDFHDILRRMHQGLQAPGSALLQAIRSRFDVAILDEFQDTDPVQADIVRLLFRHTDASLYLVGDPKQSIYGFRSADLNSYMQLRRTVDERRRLSVSHRSDQRLVDAVNTLFAVPAPFFHPEVLAESVQSVFETRRLRRDGFEDPAGLVLHAEPGQATVRECARLVASEVRALLGQGWMVRVKRDDPWRPLRPSDIAVLCRTNHELPKMAEALREVRVPCVVLGSDNVFGSEMARDLAGALLAFARPSNRGLALAAASTRLIGLSQHPLAGDPDGVVQRMRSASAVFDRHGVVAGIREWMRTAGPGLDGLATEPDGERHLSDLAQLLELLDEAERSGIKGAPALASWMAEQVDGMRAGDDQVQRVRALAEHEAVTLQTLHGSKGLTYGIVWLPSVMRAGKKEDDPEAAREAAAEARRLLYVGLTRARWQAHALWRHDKEPAHAALATLLHARGEHDAAQAAAMSLDRLGQDPAEVAKDLLAVAAQSDGAIEVRELSEPVEGRPIEMPAPSWREPLPLPRIPTAARQVSFTSLHDHLAEGDDSGQGTDRDDRGTHAPVEVGDPTPCDRALRDLGVRGVALGNLLHEALEQADVFAALARADGAALLARALERGVTGANAPARAQEAAIQIQAVLGLSAPGVPSVAEVCTHTRGVFRELKLAAGWRGGLQDLSSAFEAEPHAWAAAFAQSLRGAERQRMHGLLVGNIDLAVLSDEGWFLYDYKTNDYGRGVGAYATARTSAQLSPLDQGMIRSGYPLQAALYATLVRRWARARGFDDRSAVAGVSYLFLRGMTPGLADHGIWHWKPSVAVLDAIDAHLVHAEVPE